jgi:hypothetical protein
MAQIVLMSRAGELSPPIRLEGGEANALEITFVKVCDGRPATMFSTSFKRTEECFMSEWKLLTIYKEVVDS